MPSHRIAVYIEAHTLQRSFFPDHLDQFARGLFWPCHGCTALIVGPNFYPPIGSGFKSRPLVESWCMGRSRRVEFLLLPPSCVGRGALVKSAAFGMSTH